MKGQSPSYITNSIDNSRGGVFIASVQACCEFIFIEISDETIVRHVKDFNKRYFFKGIQAVIVDGMNTLI